MKEKLYGLFLLASPLLIGILSALFGNFDFYQQLNLPGFAPPPIVFPIVWTILYILMGISLYLITLNSKDNSNTKLFYLQLVLNFLWVLSFFRFNNLLLSFIIIIILDVFVLYLILTYYKFNKISSYLLIPYLLWIVYASYLNWVIYLIN